MREAVKNVIESNVPASPEVVKALRRHRKKLETIAYSSNCRAKKQLQQSGGAILPLILSTVLPALVSFLRR